MTFRGVCESAFAILSPVAMCLIAGLAVAQSQTSATSPESTAPELPSWAYPVRASRAPRPPDDGVKQHVPNSTEGYTLMQIKDDFSVPDWYPADHPPMPRVVAHGSKPAGVRACGFCHLPNGRGLSENAPLAGLSAAYIVHQVAEFKSGLRKSSDSRRQPMTALVAMNVADEDVQEAAQYFAAMKYQPWIRVVESETAPKTIPESGSLMPDQAGGTEPIGERVIELPEEVERRELRDSKSGFVAYVPPGSIRKGEALVTNGAGKTTPCGVCHGPDLKGVDDVPPLAGRSAIYVFRQLYDFQSGARNGSLSPLMKSVVTKLTISDMVEIAAYTASRTP